LFDPEVAGACACIDSVRCFGVGRRDGAGSRPQPHGVEEPPPPRTCKREPSAERGFVALEQRACDNLLSGRRCPWTPPSSHRVKRRQLAPPSGTPSPPRRRARRRHRLARQRRRPPRRLGARVDAGGDANRTTDRRARRRAAAEASRPDGRDDNSAWRDARSRRALGAAASTPPPRAPGEKARFEALLARLGTGAARDADVWWDHPGGFSQHALSGRAVRRVPRAWYASALRRARKKVASSWSRRPILTRHTSSL